MAWINPRAQAAALALSVTALAIGTSACSNGNALGSGRSACKWVSTSIATLHGIASNATAEQRQQQTLLAQSQLLRALPEAASATSADGSYNALQTNIQEATRVPEAYLVPALVAMCKVIDSPTPYLGS